MSVLAIIPARLAATRLPRKPLRMLAGVPLIVRVFEHVAALNVADRCMVATDDSEVMAVCSSHNVPALITSSNHPSGTDRVAEAAKKCGDGAFDIILNVQGDEPFIGRDALLGAVDVVRNGLAPVGTAAAHVSAEMLSRPDVVKVVCTDDGRALYFSRAPIPFMRDASDAALQASLVRQHIGIYCYTREALDAWVKSPPHPLELCERLEQLRPLANGITIGVAHASRAERGIDTEEDLEDANVLWSSRFPTTVIERVH